MENSPQYWETIIDTMMDGLMVVNPEGTIVSVNRAMEELTGFHRQELVGQDCSVLNSNTCFGRSPGAKGRRCELFAQGQVNRKRCVMTKKDGSPLHVLKNAALLKDAQGRVIGGVETLTDLSAVKAREKVITRLRRELTREDGFGGLIGKSRPMLQLFQLLESAAQSEAPVMIAGESGTGKELAAAAIHRLSPRRQAPFIRVNIAALNQSLLESELFGHVKGAFTGADRTRVGRFEAAHGGSILLDEVGDLPGPTQAKLLRVLQEKIIEKVGDQRPIRVDVRIITATHQDLGRLMAEGGFREDLYYRIGVIPIHMPSLRDRREDIALLLEAFIQRAADKTGKAITGVSQAGLELLWHYDWPGNVRELINVVDYAFVRCPGGLILPEHLPPQVLRPEAASPLAPPTPHQDSPPADDREALVQALNAAGGKVAEAARLLGISRVTLWKRLKSHNLSVKKIVS